MGILEKLIVSLSSRFVAVLTPNPALNSIISMVLDCNDQLNVQTFDRAEVLQTHLRIAPVDLIVCDYELGELGSGSWKLAPQFVVDMHRQLPTRQFQVIVLTNSIDAELQQSCKFAGIDEVIVKPMSPLFLKDRIVARLEKGPKNDPVIPDIGGLSASVSRNNVVQLFPE